MLQQGRWPDMLDQQVTYYFCDVHTWDICNERHCLV